MDSTRDSVRPVESGTPIFTSRRRVAGYWFMIAALSIVVICFFSAKLTSSGRFDSAPFSVGAVAGLLAAAAVLVGLSNKMKSGVILENAVLIKFRPSKWANLAGMLIVIAGLYVLFFLIDEGELWSFLFGFMSTTPFVVLLGTLLLESKSGKVYVIY